MTSARKKRANSLPKVFFIVSIQAKIVFQNGEDTHRAFAFWSKIEYAVEQADEEQTP